MPNTILRNISQVGFRPSKALLFVGLPVLLLLAYAGSYLINLDVAGWMHGFSHPLQGWDHQITMLAVGIWAAQMRGRAIWMLPLAFVSVMSLGGIAGAAGVAIPHSESVILFSCAIFAVLITRKIRFSTKVNVLIVAFFAFFHGLAHGQEISTSTSLLSYTLGFMVATLMLHGAGIVVAKLLLLAAACFFTMLFASTAQADEWHSNSSQAALTELAHSKNLFELLHNNQRLTNLPGTLSSPSIPRDLQINQHLEPVPHSVIHQVTGKSAVYGHTLNHEASKTYRSRHDQALIWPYFGNEPLSLAGFSGYYPNINNSPGTGLSSNGVGLTSPPELIANLLVTSALSSPFSPNTQSLEAAALQLLLSKIHKPNLAFSIFSDRRQYFAPHFDFAAIAPIFLAKPAIAFPVFHVMPFSTAVRPQLFKTQNNNNSIYRYRGGYA